MDLAVSEGHLETVKWLHEHGCDGCTPHAMRMAARNGHLDVLQWLHANQTEGWSAYVMDLAAGEGHLDIVKWLHENRREGCTDLGMDKAARNGHAHVLRWLVEHYPDRCGEKLMEISGWEGHLEVVQFLDENTKQRASGWGLGAAAKRGWMKTLLVLTQNNYRGKAVDWDGLIAIGKAFDEILAHLSNEDVTPKSSLWSETLESLELFHSGGYYSCVSLMLQRALRRGYLALVQRFIGLRDESEKSRYVAVASNRWEIVLLRWLLAHGTHIDTSSAIQLATERCFTEYVEVAGYLSEGDRVELVCAAVTKTTLDKLLLWTLENTSFTGSRSRVTICNAIKQGPRRCSGYVKI